MKEEAKKTEQNEILLILMFSGGYLEKNIGHEIINLFQTDKGEHYIYVNPYGNYDEKHYGKIGKILLGRHIGKDQVELIAKAEVEEEILEKGTKHRKVQGGNTVSNDKNKTYCKEKEITYGGILINEIFKSNKNENDQVAFVSFKVKNYRKTCKEIILSYNDKNDKKESDGTFFLEKNKHFSNEAMKAYFDESTEKINKIFQNNELWETEDNSQKIDKRSIEQKTEQKPEVKENFLKIIKKEYDEVVFSNLFQYYLSEKFNLMKDFAKEVLGIDNFENKEDWPERERAHTDLWFENDDMIIIIENKLKSGINGDQLDKYHEYVNKVKKGNQEAKFFIFIPKYSKIKEDDCDKFTPITYDKIYNFFKNHRVKEEQSQYYNDFVDALEKHTKTQYEEMYSRFLEAISKAKGNEAL